jgi:HAD superfamily hydrolase (TIGR01509 family)
MNNPVIALDIGNVCVKLQLNKAASALDWMPDAAFPDAFAKTCAQYEYGHCTHDEWMDAFQQVTGGKFTDQELLAAWNLIIGEPIEGMAEAIQELTELGFQFVYFSDTNKPHIEKFYRTFSANPLVKGHIFSYDVGAHKPAPEMFDAFEAAYGKPCFYVDDKACNIEGAIKHGWTAHPFTTTEQFRNAFRQSFGV